MNCNPGNRFDYLEMKIRGWLELALYGLTKQERARSRRNFRHLVRKYPVIADYCGFSEEEALIEWQAHK